MSMPSVLEGAIGQLIRRGLPADYAERAVTELADHHGELVEELSATGMDERAVAHEALRRLGDPRTLVKRTVREYQRRYWSGRWPLLTFLLGPVFTLALMWVGACVAMTAIGYLGTLCGFESDGRMDRGELLGSYGVWIAFTMLLPCLVAAMYWRIANRSAMAWPWPLTSCLTLALVAGQLFVTIDPAKATVTAGIMLIQSPHKWLIAHPSQLLQFALPLLMVILLLARQRFKATALQVA